MAIKSADSKSISKKRRADSKDQLELRYTKIISFLKKAYPDAKCHLNYNSALELLVGSILSAQCTDKRVNQVTPSLFKKYSNAKAFASANRDELEQDIRSTGFYKNKATSIVECTRALVDNYKGEVPESMEQLTELRGVGRKTANVVRGNYYKKPAIIVDTHIKRLSNRLGLSSFSDPTKIEYDLMEIVPEGMRTFFSNALGDHGRVVCKARRPLCESCGLGSICPSVRTE